MQNRKIIRVGDATSEGGVVVTGDPKRKISGKAIARKGDLVDCPGRYPNGELHGINPIVEGDKSKQLNGRAIALEGHRTQCGCVLLASARAFVG